MKPVRRALALVDGDHYPPVVRAAIDHLPQTLPGVTVVAALLVGGEEKLAHDLPADLGLGVEVIRPHGAGATGSGSHADVARSLVEAITRLQPDLVVDLSDEPALDARRRLALAARTLAAGVAYVGSDFRLSPPRRPRLSTKPAIAVIGTGKRTGKTAISASMARLLAGSATLPTPVVVAMGRGGPPEPELVDPGDFDLSAAGLLRLARSGRHAASDHLEDALVAGVATVGTRRCGGGLAGAPFDDTFAAGVALANQRPEGLTILEGSGSAIPPAHADATVCVVPAGMDPDLLTGYLGAYRVLLSDLIVVTMAEAATTGSELRTDVRAGDSAPPDVPSRSGPSASGRGRASLEESVRDLVPGAWVVHVVLRPWPLEPISGRRVFHVTTAPATARDVLVTHLESHHGASVVGISHNLARRAELLVDLDDARNAEVLLVELKAAAVDVVAQWAERVGMPVVFCDNRPVTVGGDGRFDDLALATAGLAVDRFRPDQARPGRAR